MPELPEVETIKRALEPIMTGHSIDKVETFIDVMRYPLKPLHAPELTNSKIVSVRRRGRYIIIELENLQAFIVHLGMSGSIRVVPPEVQRKKHEHIVIYLNSGETFRFDCPRRFGFMKVATLEKSGALPQELAHLGAEPLSEEFTAEYLHTALKKRHGNIKSVIMDNKLVVGVGNIYAAESLFMSKISPLRTASTLTLKQCSALVAVIKDVLTRAIEAGGTTIADYKSVDGSEGKFVLQLRMYGKDGQPCPECGDKIEQRRLGGRSSCYCPRCQK
ncbi:MAG: bifunctional DNA-formamidopyrimidine glycosylase/DNA-(apurinic or apyrimidinic site) lyase [Victivallaceae bacterium]